MCSLFLFFFFCNRCLCCCCSFRPFVLSTLHIYVYMCVCDTFNFQVFALRCLGFKYNQEHIKSCCPDTQLSICHPIQKLPPVVFCIIFLATFSLQRRETAATAPIFTTKQRKKKNKKKMRKKKKTGERNTRIDKHLPRSLLIHHSVFIFSLLSVADALLFQTSDNRVRTTTATMTTTTQQQHHHHHHQSAVKRNSTFEPCSFFFTCNFALVTGALLAYQLGLSPSFRSNYFAFSSSSSSFYR